MARSTLPVEVTPSTPFFPTFTHSFSVQGEFVDAMAGEPSLMLWNIIIDSASRRKGLGKHLLVLLELIARRNRMRFLSLPVVNGDDATRDWYVRRGVSFSCCGALL